jgi:hypothetical protein
VDVWRIGGRLKKISFFNGKKYSVRGEIRRRQRIGRAPGLVNTGLVGNLRGRVLPNQLRRKR